MSLLHREATAIQIGLAQLGFPYHTTYVGLGPDPCLHTSTLTQILLYENRSSTTREHSTHFTMLFVHDGFTEVCYMVLPLSLHSQCVVIVSHTRISQMLGLPEYVSSTASHDHRQLYNDQSLFDTGGVTMSRSILGASQDSAQSRFIKYDHSHTSGSSLTLAKPTFSIYI
jgi:hypothetical protein